MLDLSPNRSENNMSFSIIAVQGLDAHKSADHFMGDLYRNQEKLGDAEDMYVHALAGYETALRPEHTSTLRTVLCLGNLYKHQGKLREAEDMYMRALAGYEKAFGSENGHTVAAQKNLANLKKTPIPKKRQGILRLYLRFILPA